MAARRSRRAVTAPLALAAAAGALALGMGGAARAQSLPTPSVYYTFEGVSGKTVTNLGSLGSAENGTTSNTNQTASPGYGSATALATTSSAYMTIPTFDLGSSFTIFTYAKLPNQTTTLNNDINSIWANSNGGSSSNGFRFYVNSYQTNHTNNPSDDNGTLHLEMGNGTSGASFTSTGTVKSLANPITSTFHSLAVTVSEAPSGSNAQYTVAFYIDGVAAGSGTTTLTGAAALTNATGYVGSLGTSNYTVGNYDDFQIYNTALNSGQIANLDSTFRTAAAPEPSALALAGLGFAAPAAGLLRRRRRRRAAANA